MSDERTVLTELTSNGVSRRDFLKGGAIFSAAAVGVSVLGACSPQTDGGGGTGDGADAGASGATGTDNAFDYESLTGKSTTDARYDFKYVNQPGKIGNLEVKNRIVKSAASGAEAPWDSEAGEWSKTALEFYRSLARGGTGMIIHDTLAFKTGAMSQASLMSEADIPLHTPLIDAVHAEGSLLFVQQFSADNVGMSIPGMPPPDPRASSTFAQPGADQGMNEMSPRMMTAEEVEEQIEQWASGVLMAMKAGFDGVEINAGSNHIGANFISRFWNRERTDEYGSQNIENLGRFVTGILDRARELCGSEYPIGVLINGHEWNVFNVGDNEHCNSLLLQCELAKLFEKHGASFIHVRSAAWGAHMLDIFPDVAFIHDEPDTGYGHPLEIEKFWPDFIQDYRGAGAFLNTAAEIKAAVSIPIITTGMMDARLIPDVIDKYIGDEKIDFIGVTRRMYADPDYANKVCAGELDEIRPCANCISCWHDYCRVNAGLARAGGEEMPEGYVVEPAATPKKVLVAGGGPAGLEAARVAAERGHEVTLYEKDGSWGGLTRTAVAYKGQNEKINDHIDWLVRQCEKYGVSMSTDKEVTATVVGELAPDVFVDATGGKPNIPSITGIDGSNVVVGTVPDGNKVAVIGGQIEGIEIAIFLYKQGKEVIVLEQGPEENLGLNIPPEIKAKYICWCQTHGIKLYPDVAIDKITDTGVTFTHNYGLTETLACDNVAVAMPVLTDTSLLDEVKGSVAEAYAIGNANEYGLIREAVRDGNLLARHL
ncbi:MAG: FAD-dependent oxidoreductase [Coriobacteriales bacterium]|jgi:2,4-dienoyl-CoA reductase-like NADH-dependent reductase (Old Yellow Enzyme family)/thioredoxin reductase|nr:FAD-dependent oxidoreductase [Coriobacteriales bacterium]